MRFRKLEGSYMKTLYVLLILPIFRYERVLGRNHYLLLSAKYLLCQIYGRIEGYLLHTMPLEDVERKEHYCRDFLRVVDVLEPGLTRLRGTYVYVVKYLKLNFYLQFPLQD